MVDLWTAGAIPGSDQPIIPMPRTILLADDEPQVLALLTEVFTGQQYRLLNARNGDECLKIARMSRPDLILLDVLMPRMSGIDACRALKNDPDTAGAKVLLLTALAQDETFRRGLDAGADAIVTKPFSPMALVQKVNALLEAQMKGSCDWPRRTY